MSDIEFKSGQTVYDKAGYSYFYNAPGNGGHYVNKIVIVQVTNYHGDDLDEHEEDGELVHLTDVYAKPPVGKLNEEVSKLADQRRSLTDDVFQLNKEVKAIHFQLNKEVKEIHEAINTYKTNLEKEMRSYPGHEMFLHAAKGGELVYVDTTKFDIVPVKNLTSTSIYGGPWHKVYFDVKEGKFAGNWWNDGLVLNSDISVFRTIEEAGRWFIGNFERPWDMRIEEIRKKYESFNCTVPDDVMELLSLKEKKRVDKRIIDLQVEIKRAQDNLRNLGVEPTPEVD